MGKLNKELFVCVDCETTGLDTEKDQIIEVGAVRFTFEQIIDRFETLVDPKCPIPAASQEIHHITDKMVEGKPTIEAILPDLLSFLQEGIIIGHGILFDLKIIATAAKKHNLPCDLLDRPIIDTLRLARLYGESPIHSLEGLRKHFNIAPEAAHRALDDALVNMEVFKHLCGNFNTTEKLLDRLSRPVALKKMPFGKHKGRPFGEVPVPYMRWALSKLELDGDLRYSIISELKRRKHKGRFIDSSNPFNSL